MALREFEPGKLTPSLGIQAVKGEVSEKSRLIVLDKKSGLKFLVDTGADISVLPKCFAPKNAAPADFKLFAANNTPIETYGEKLIILDLGIRRPIRWTFTIADVSLPIIGADLLAHCGILVDLQGKRVIDRVTNLFSLAEVTEQGQSLSTISGTHSYQHLLREFVDVTFPARKKSPTKHMVFHHIFTEGPPVAQKARRLSPEKLKQAKAEFDFMLDQGICQPSESQWASPLHLVAKSNGQWRPCGDYRRLNSVTVPDKYPIAHLQDFAHQLHGRKIFSTIDLTRAYHQIPVAPEDVPKTAVITPFGLFEFNVMTFGLCNAAQTFQRYINTALRGLDFVYVYIDDILIASRTPEEHEHHLREVLQRLREFGLSINVDKCVLGASEVRYLGYLINAQGTKPLPDRVNAIINFKKPETISELRRFLGMINFYRRALKGAAATQAPLHDLLVGAKKKDKRPVSWTPSAERAFEECKKQIAEATLLRHPLENAELALQCDASDTAMGAVLEQLNNGVWEPLGFFSKKFSDAQRRYSTYDRELQAIYSGLKHFRDLVEGRQLMIKTDHKPLVFAFQQKATKASPRQLRQLDFIGQFTTTIAYIPGEDNVTADALSRVNQICMPVAINEEDLAQAQKDDEELKQILASNTKLKLLEIRPNGTDITLFCDITATGAVRPYVPKSLRRQVFEVTHNLSHPNGRVTKKLIKEKYVWPSMSADIAFWSRTCLACQRSKIGRHVHMQPQHIPVPNVRFDHVHIDIIGPMHPSQGYMYCLTMIDRFTRWPEAAPLKNITAESVAEAFYITWISRFGAPSTLTTDQGSQFNAMLFKALAHLVGGHKTQTTAYHPQSNGMVERWHRALKSAIICHNNAEWVSLLPTVLLGLRTSIKEDIGATAAELVYGTNLRIPGEFFINEDMPPDPQIFIEKFRMHMRKVRATPTAHHHKRKIFIFKDLYTCTHVFVRIDRVKKPLEPPYEGPYKVTARPSDRVFTLDINGKETNVTVERLKPAYFETAAEPQQHDVPAQDGSRTTPPDSSSTAAPAMPQPPVTTTQPQSLVPAAPSQPLRQYPGAKNKGKNTVTFAKDVKQPVLSATPTTGKAPSPKKRRRPNILRRR